MTLKQAFDNGVKEAIAQFNLGKDLKGPNINPLGTQSGHKINSALRVPEFPLVLQKAIV